MLIKVTYNKQDGSITLDKDVKNIELSQSSIIDDSEELYFEIAVDTSEYEHTQSIEETV